MAFDDYSPRYVGDTSNPLQITFTDHEGISYSLVGLLPGNFLLRLVNTVNGAVTIGQGVWSIISATTGFAQYAWNALDTAVPGLYTLHITIAFAAGPLTFDAKVLEILRA